MHEHCQQHQHHEVDEWLSRFSRVSFQSYELNYQAIKLNTRRNSQKPFQTWWRRQKLGANRPNNFSTRQKPRPQLSPDRTPDASAGPLAHTHRSIDDIQQTRLLVQSPKINISADDCRFYGACQPARNGPGPDTGQDAVWQDTKRHS